MRTKPSSNENELIVTSYKQLLCVAMTKAILKFMLYSLSLFLCAFILVKVGNELLVQVAMLIEGVSGRDLLEKDSGIATIGIVLWIPEILFGAIGGWYLAEWADGKIWDD